MDRLDHQPAALDLSRRHLIVSSLTAAGGFALGIALSAQAQAAALAPDLWSAEGPPAGELSAWLIIDRDNTVTMRLPHAELGQGAATALPMIVADELACDWTKVKVEYASANRSLRENNVYKDMTTVGSRATRGSLAFLQQAGASARVRLVAAAAQRWGVPAAACEAKDSMVVHTASGRSATYGALAPDAVRIKLDAEPAVKTPEQFTVIGKPLPRLDIPLKINGSAKYAIDTRLPGMVYAAVMSCPVPGGKLKSVDAQAVVNRRGIQNVVPMEDAVAVVADRYWRAKQALDALPIEWDFGANGAACSEQFNKDYRAALDGSMVSARDDGNVDEAFGKAAKFVEATYEVPYLAHAPMEPLNATVHLQADRLDAWIGSQSPPAALKLAAQVSGLKPEQVYVHNTYVGGGFGRKTAHDELAHAVAVAKVAGKPVKLIWSREQDMRHDRYRPQAALQFKAVLGGDGLPSACHIKTAVGSLLRSLGTDKVEKGVEPMAVSGLATTAYKIPNLRVGCALKNTHIPVMFWRSVGDSQNAFAMESFIDELAHAAQADPAKFRRAMLDREDYLNVLDTLVEKSNWGTPMAAGKGRGIAIHECYGSIVGQVAEVAVERDGGVKVERVVAAVDCGHVVNPRIVESQVEGGIIWGLSALLFGEITVKNGRVEQGNFDDYAVARMADTPKIEVHFALSGGTKWGGIGEPGSAPLAAAVCNAIFAATGKRIRALPLKNHNLATAV